MVIVLQKSRLQENKTHMRMYIFVGVILSSRRI